MKNWNPVICPTCKGNGKYEVIVGQFDKTDVVDCPTCNGSGIIMIQKPIKCPDEEQNNSDFTSR